MAALYKLNNQILALLPLSLPTALALFLIGNPIPIVTGWAQHFSGFDSRETKLPLGVPSQLLAYIMVAIAGNVTTAKLVPNIKQYTLRKGICGKDLGKKGTATADIPVPEALGIVPGAVFLVCLILCLVGYTAIHSSKETHLPDNKLLDVNSALLSICFMLFLGFTDDVLDWPWRYKLVLPTVASLPLLCCYSGSTTIVVPKHLRPLLWDSTNSADGQEGRLTGFGTLVSKLLDIDYAAAGSLIDLGFFYLLYMSMLAVFCTNAINIFAGINGLEAGQSYVIGAAILIHNLVEIIILQRKEGVQVDEAINNHLFSIMVLCSFVGTCLGLLRHNWYPASVFVGDTFCYFAGMTFAVVGILGHFSKTLLLFFIPQIINFIWSVPQLFKIVPCPRHRLPAFNPADGLCHPSTFPCKPDEFKWLKLRLLGAKPSDTAVANMTVLNLCLQILGPMSERNLCVTLLLFQILCCSFGFFCRYYVAKFFFDD